MTVVDLGLRRVVGHNMWSPKLAAKAVYRLRSFTYGSYRWCGLSSGRFRDELVMKALLERVGDSKVQLSCPIWHQT